MHHFDYQQRHYWPLVDLALLWRRVTHYSKWGASALKWEPQIESRTSSQEVTEDGDVVQPGECSPGFLL